MKRNLFIWLFVAIALAVSVAFAGPEPAKPKIILFIAEQNIDSPRTVWWASEVDLSATEAGIAQKLIEKGFDVLEPSQLEGILKKDKAFRMLDLSEKESVKIGNLSQADFVVVGKAIASSGGPVPESTMRSCFANLSAKVVRVKDGKVTAYITAGGSSVHVDVITGGREALLKAAAEASAKIIEAIEKQG